MRSVVKTEDNKVSKNKKQNIIKVFFKLAPTIFWADPLLITIDIVISILHGVFWGVETMVQQKFFDAATMLTTGQMALKGVILALCLLALANITCQVLNGVANYIPNILYEKITGILSMGIHKKIARIDPICFEDTAKLDDINKAENGKNSAFWFVGLVITIFAFYLPYFIFMGWYLFTLKPILALSIILVFIPTAATQLVRSKIFTKLEDKSAPVRREYEYYESCMVSREYFKETRLLGGFSYFKKLYMDSLKLLHQLKFKANMKTNLMELGMRIVTVAGYFGILYMLFDALMKQEITVGAFAAVFNSIGMLYGIMEEVICRHMGTIAQNLGSIQNYINLLEMPEREGKEIALSKGFDISLENVSFSYPGAEREAVQNASFTIHHGETLAVVGENGSGKSTIIRLITGLYTPTKGKVSFGEINASTLSMKTLFSRTSAVFQKFQKYQLKLSDNIGISKVETPITDENLDNVCEKSGLDISDSSFKDGYETMLSREFDGVDLSGGQWQRVAIARGFYRDHDLIVLDEPTAAIDPYEETRIYNKFAQASKDKTAIIVTHRLGSVKLADRIIVMKDGQVVQIGTHEQLIHQEGEYARLYKAQEQWYTSDHKIS
jgi:ATP-binding cassette subfamily B protein